MPPLPAAQAQIMAIERLLSKHRADCGVTVENVQRIVHELQTGHDKQAAAERQTAQLQATKYENMERQLNAALEQNTRCRMELRQAKEIAASVTDKNEQLAEKLRQMELSRARTESDREAAEVEITRCHTHLDAARQLCLRMDKTVVTPLDTLAKLHEDAERGIEHPNGPEIAEESMSRMLQGWSEMRNGWQCLCELEESDPSEAFETGSANGQEQN